LAERLVRLGVDRRRVRVIYDGVATRQVRPGSRREARTQLGLPDDLPVVRFVGNLVPVKGNDVLIEACARLTSDDVRFSCHLIGQGPLRGQIERLIAYRGLTERVRLVGSRPHEQLPDWYRAANVVVLPSHSEGMPNVLLEAAACGTQFVASRVGGIPEIAHLGASRLIPPGDSAALADAVRGLLTATTPRPGNGGPDMRSGTEAALELADFFEQVIELHGRTTTLLPVSSRND